MAMPAAKESDGRILDRLTAALRKDGDFPVRAKVVSDLRALAAKPNTPVEQISELILREPSLGTRVLHLANSSFFQRTQPVTTVTQAVVQLGMKALSDMCAGLVLMQKFVPAAKRGGVFADAVRRTIVTSLLSNRIAGNVNLEGLAEQGYLAGTFQSLGHLLLAYYFPQVYETAARRAHARGKDVSKSIAEILGTSSLDITLALVTALSIPDYYKDVLVLAEKPLEERKGEAVRVALSVAVSTAAQMAEAIVHGSKQQLDSVVETAVEKKILRREKFEQALSELPELFKQHCELIELNFLALPDFVMAYKIKRDGGVAPTPKAEEQTNGFASYIREIRAAIAAKDPVSTVTTFAMESLVYALGYDRAMLLYADSDQTKLLGRMALGKPFPVSPKSVERPLEQSLAKAVDVRAFRSSVPQYMGDSPFEDGWPFVAIPVGIGNFSKGVIYADMQSTDKSKPLDENAQAALSVLTELLDESVRSWE